MEVVISSPPCRPIFYWKGCRLRHYSSGMVGGVGKIQEIVTVTPNGNGLAPSSQGDFIHSPCGVLI